MRKIEQQMLNAIKNGNNWASGNTTVKQTPDNFSEVYLHGNLIASVKNADTEIVLVEKVTLKNYPTNTTISRLRALGVDVCKRRGKIFLDGSEI